MTARHDSASTKQNQRVTNNGTLLDLHSAFWALLRGHSWAKGIRIPRAECAGKDTAGGGGDWRDCQVKRGMKRPLASLISCISIILSESIHSSPFPLHPFAGHRHCLSPRGFAISSSLVSRFPLWTPYNPFSPLASRAVLVERE